MRDRFTRIALLIAIILLIGFVAEPYIARFFYAEQAPRAVTPRGDLAPIERTNVELFERAAPSVVHVFAQARARRESSSRERRAAVSRPAPASSGTRPATSSRTTHVVQNAGAIAIRLSAGEIIRADDRRHGAELRSRRGAPRRAAPPLPAHRGRHIVRPQGRAGAFAIGNPFGLDQTLTTGVISALQRRIPTAEGRGARRRDPDRRGHQSRQLGRPASRLGRPRSSASIRRSSRPPAPRPASASRSRSTW